MTGFFEFTLGGFIGSGVATAIVGAILLKRNKTTELEIVNAFAERMKVFESTRVWKERVLSSLLGPMIMQLDRTRLAFNRWTSKNLYLEAKVVRTGNETVRDLLLANGHLIPPHLLPHASKLVEHYDRWLEEFDKIRADASLSNSETFVFAGPAGCPFPVDSEQCFRKEFGEIQHALYGV